MAKRLDKSDIVSLNTIRPYHVSQSVDAFTGTDAYDINISGSFQVTGSTTLSGSVTMQTLTNTAQTDVLTYNSITGRVYYTASNAFGAPLDTGSFYKQNGNSFGATAVLGTNDNNSLQFETNATTKMHIGTDGNVGVNTTTPLGKFTVSGSGGYLSYNDTDAAGNLVVLSGSSDELVRNDVSALSGSFSTILSYGVRGVDETSHPGYGKPGDAFIYASNLANGLNIINQGAFGSIKEDYIRFYAGTDASSSANNFIPDIHVQGSGSTRGYVGIHTETPTSHLHVSGTLANGDTVSTPGIFSHAEGIRTLASGNYSHAEGEGTIASGIGAHAEGKYTTASGDYSHAEGYQTIASGTHSRTEGRITVASGSYSHAEGNITLATGISSHTEGYQTTSSGNYSHAEGLSTQTIGYSSHAEGRFSVASGSYSHAEGNYTFAGGDISHAEGYYTSASGDYSHAEGFQTLAQGYSSHADGKNTCASGSYSHAEGQFTTASGDSSHTEGYQTFASGNYSHTEGIGTSTIGYASHAEGTGSIASGSYSHAEGSATNAIGVGSHSEGYQTSASGNYSHAEGQGTKALGEYSYAGGIQTIASGSPQHVIGKYNTQGDNTSLFIVGSGDSITLKDAFKVTHSSSIIVATQSISPSWVGVEGEIKPVATGGNFYLYVYIGNNWRRTALTLPV